MSKPGGESAARPTHTPGPWTTYDRGIGWEVNGPDGETVNQGFRDTFTEADARLIAAAPELLAALKRIMPMARDSRHEDFSTVDGIEDTKTEAIKYALSAIAKAEVSL